MRIPPCKDTFSPRAAPTAWPVSARKLKSVLKINVNNGDGNNLCGEVEEGSNEEVEEKPIRELLPGIYRFILRHILFRHIFFCQK